MSKPPPLPPPPSRSRLPVEVRGILAGLLLAGTIGGVIGYVGWDGSQVGLALESPFWFALWMALAGFYLGNCLAGPWPVRKVLIFLVPLCVLVLLGYIWVETGEMGGTWRRGWARVTLFRGPLVRALGLLVLLAAGALSVWFLLREKPRTVSGWVGASLGFVIFLVGLILAIRVMT